MLLLKLILCFILIVAAIGERMNQESTKNGTGIKDDPEIIVIQEEADVFLNCEPDFHRFHPQFVSWEFGKNETSMEPLGNKETIKQLVIERIKQHDSGFYRCIFYGGKKLGHQHWFKLIVEEPVPLPKILELDNTDFGGYYGFKRRLSCKAIGNPRPHIRWFKEKDENEQFQEISDNEFYSSKRYGRELEVDISVNTLGSYKCQACNDYGCTEKNMTLNLWDLPRTSCDQDITYDVSEGDSILISCYQHCSGVFGRYHNPPHEYYYVGNDEQFEVAVMEGRRNWKLQVYPGPIMDLAISNLSLSKDTGRFFCRIDTPGGYYLGNWTVQDRNKTSEVATFGTREVREAYGEVQMNMFLHDMLYTIACVISICMLIYGLYLAFFKQAKIDREIDSFNQVVTERISESISSEYYYYPRDTVDYA